MEDIKQYIFTLLAERGYLVSQQRRIIIDSLCQLEDIKNAEDLWISIRRTHHIGWATVHNTIRLLEKLGLLSRNLSRNRPQEYTLSLPCGSQNTDCI